MTFAKCIIVLYQLIHQGQTIVGCISLSPFRNLQELELVRVPLHLLEGLDKQRHKLQMLTVLRSVTSLKVKQKQTRSHAVRIYA